MNAGPAPAVAAGRPPAPTTGRTLARAGLIVTGAFLASRVLGYVRVALITAIFGASAPLDTFYAAFRIPDLIFQLVAAGALSSSLIPIVAGLLATEQEQRAWRVVSTVTNLMLGLLLVLSVGFALAAPVVVPLITPGFDAVQTARTVELTRIMLWSPVLLSMGALATSLLNAQGRFAASALAPLAYNVAICVAAVLLVPAFGVVGLAFGVVLGSTFHFLVQLPQVLRGGFRYEPEIGLDDVEARHALTLLAPRALGLGVSQLTFVVSTTLASGLQAGSITAFNYAFTLLQVPIGVIGVPLGVVLFPSLARELALGSHDQFVALLTRAVRLLLFVMLPITGLAVVLRRQVVAILAFGQFGPDAVDLTANTLLFFLIGLAAHALIAVVARAFYAQQDTRTPVGAAILAVAINVPLAIVLVGPLGTGGLALAIAIGAWAEAALLLAILGRRVAGFTFGPIARVTLEAGLGAIVASVAALATVYGIDALVGHVPGRLVLVLEASIATIVGGGLFVAVAVALRIPELAAIVGLMVELVHRPRRASRP